MDVITVIVSKTAGFFDEIRIISRTHRKKNSKNSEGDKRQGTLNRERGTVHN